MWQLEQAMQQLQVLETGRATESNLTPRWEVGGGRPALETLPGVRATLASLPLPPTATPSREVVELLKPGDVHPAVPGRKVV